MWTLSFHVWVLSNLRWILSIRVWKLSNRTVLPLNIPRSWDFEGIILLSLCDYLAVCEICCNFAGNSLHSYETLRYETQSTIATKTKRSNDLL